MSRGGRVFIVEADARARVRASRIVARMGREVVAFAGAREFLAAAAIGADDCVIVGTGDARGTGIALVRHLARAATDTPVIGLGPRGDVMSAVRTMKLGAVDYLVEPFDSRSLASALDSAAAKSRAAQGAGHGRARTLVGRLTPREREILLLVLRGYRNKQIAAALASRESTVKVHRSRLMRKLEVRTVAEMVPVFGVIEREVLTMAPPGDARRVAASSPVSRPPRGAGVNVGTLPPAGRID